MPRKRTITWHLFRFFPTLFLQNELYIREIYIYIYTRTIGPVAAGRYKLYNLLNVKSFIYIYIYKYLVYCLLFI